MPDSLAETPTEGLAPPGSPPPVTVLPPQPWLPSREMPSPPSFIGQPVKVARAYEALAAIIRERIVSGALAEGDRIPSETALAHEAQVSRSTVREALRTLEEAGLIARASPKIMVVRRATDERALDHLKGALQRRNVTFNHLHEALLVLEPELTRLATVRAEAADLERLEAQLASQADSLDDVGGFCRLDQQFHLAVAEMSANPALVMARAPISELLAPIMETFMVSPTLTRRSLEYHHRIVEEIRVRDADAAALMARKHVNDLRASWEVAGLNFELQVGEAPDEAASRPALVASAGLGN
jgi:GntR family transcriptional repressor for pyruvate dehydrogenase complex